MKKLILLFSVTVLLFACKDKTDVKKPGDPQCDSLTTAEFNAIPKLDSATVAQMAFRYKTISHHIDSNITKTIRIDDGCFYRKLLHNTKKILYVVGSYLPGDTSSAHLQRKYTVIMHILNNDQTRYYFDMCDMGPTVMAKVLVCPPPKDCDLTTLPASE